MVDYNANKEVEKQKKNAISCISFYHNVNNIFVKPLHYKINNTSQCKASTRKEISIKIRIFGIDCDICFLLQYEIVMLFRNSIVLWRYLAVLYFLVYKVVQKYDINCFDNLSSKIAHIYSKPNLYVTFGSIS